MSTTDQSGGSALHTLHAVGEVRLAPQFVNRLCARLETAETKANGVGGLLFGAQCGSLLIVQAFRSLTEIEQTAIEAGQMNVERVVQELIQAAEKDPGLAMLDVVGWYSFREQAGLEQDDTAFHQNQFPSESDVALLVRRVDGAFLLFEFYTTGEGETFAARSYRMGAARFSPAQPTTAIVDVPLRSRTEQPHTMSATAGTATRVSAERSGQAVVPRAATAELQEVPEEIGEPEVKKIKIAERTILPATLALPAPIKATPLALPMKRKIPWRMVAALFAGAAGGTFALLVLPSIFSIKTGRGPTDNGLNLHVEAQGDRLMLSWNRNNAIAQSAISGLLHIDDGTLHRDVQLDGAQMANGAVLYHANTDDVNFRLQVVGKNGSTLAEDLRIVDGRTAVPSIAARVKPPADGGQPNVSANGKTAMETPSRLGASPQSSTELTGAASPNRGPERLAVVNSPVPQPNSGSVQTTLNTDTSSPESVNQTARSGDTVAANTAETTVAQTSTQAPAQPPEQTTPEPISDLQPPPAPGGKQNVQAAAHPNVSGPGISFAQRYAPPKPIRQVLPNLTALPASVLSSADRLSVTVKVDERGHVANVQLENVGKSVARSLVQVAETAAKQWIFEPARLDGKPVASEHTIVFQFGH